MNDHDHPLDLQKDTVNGLSLEETKKRLVEYGYNEVPEKRPNPIQKLLARAPSFNVPILYFSSPIAFLGQIRVHPPQLWQSSGKISTFSELTKMALYWQDSTHFPQAQLPAKDSSNETSCMRSSIGNCAGSRSRCWHSIGEDVSPCGHPSPRRSD